MRTMLPVLPSRAVTLATVILVALGALGGLIASGLRLPIPFLLGALVASGAAAMLLPQRFPEGYKFPHPLRATFVGVIGTMIGTRVDPAFVAQIPKLAVTLTGVAVFVLVAHALTFLVMRKVAGYDRATAFYCASPGGLVESITLGEAAGADLRVLALHHFLRVILVVSALPLALSLYYGRALGSAGGEGLSQGAGTLADLLPLALICAAGLLLGKGLRLPAGQLSGPLLLSGVASGAGLMSLHPPDWATQVAQVVIGVSLGARFMGVTRSLLLRTLGFSILAVTVMLLVGGAVAEILHLISGEPWDVLLISLAPGGVIEMGLVALSLSVNPAFVTVHHLFRIVLTVIEITTIGRLIAPPRKAD